MKNDLLVSLDVIAQTIFDKKGANILALDLRSFSTLTDFVILAEGTVDRHVIAIANAVDEALAKLGQHPVNTEGMKEGDWVVLDYLSIMVHLFTPGTREKYCLEELWKKGEIVSLNIILSPNESVTCV